MAPHQGHADWLGDADLGFVVQDIIILVSFNSDTYQ